MMLAAPPRARTGTLEPIAAAIAATIRKQFREFFMPGTLLWRRRITGRVEKPSGGRGMPPSGAHHLPQSHLRGGTATVTQILRGKSVMATHCAGMTLQLLRPDIRQSCILLVAVSSRASHSPTTSNTTAIARPAMAPRRLPPGSVSAIARKIRKQQSKAADRCGSLVS